MSSSLAAKTPVPIIGIVGGVGSGKSTLARWVAEHHPAIVIDADRIGHELLLEPRVRSALRATFGDGIFAEDGSVIRAALARRVFGDSPEQQAARKQLDGLMHPLIREEILHRASAVDPQTTRVVLLDAALLLEAGLRNDCRAVVFVDTPAARRLQWVQQHRGWAPDELSRREASQWPLEKKRQSADEVIVNDGEIAAAGSALWQKIQVSLPQETR